jgi:hypothetical protein
MENEFQRLSVRVLPFSALARGFTFYTAYL